MTKLFHWLMYTSSIIDYWECYEEKLNLSDELILGLSTTEISMQHVQIYIDTSIGT